MHPVVMKATKKEETRTAFKEGGKKGVEAHGKARKAKTYKMWALKKHSHCNESCQYDKRDQGNEDSQRVLPAKKIILKERHPARRKGCINISNRIRGRKTRGRLGGGGGKTAILSKKENWRRHNRGTEGRAARGCPAVKF